VDDCFKKNKCNPVRWDADIGSNLDKIDTVKWEILKTWYDGLSREGQRCAFKILADDSSQRSDKEGDTLRVCLNKTSGVRPQESKTILGEPDSTDSKMLQKIVKMRTNIQFGLAQCQDSSAAVRLCVNSIPLDFSQYTSAPCNARDSCERKNEIGEQDGKCRDPFMNAQKLVCLCVQEAQSLLRLRLRDNLATIFNDDKNELLPKIKSCAGSVPVFMSSRSVTKPSTELTTLAAGYIFAHNANYQLQFCSNCIPRVIANPNSNMRGGNDG
jgi:hypothetical protein